VSASERFVTAAYVVFLASLLVYVLIHGLKVSRLARDVERLEGDRAQEERP
jgi:hypothetical protein